MYTPLEVFGVAIAALIIGAVVGALIIGIMASSQS
jgi:hypothetical protein